FYLISGQIESRGISQQPPSSENQKPLSKPWEVSAYSRREGKGTLSTSFAHTTHTKGTENEWSHTSYAARIACPTYLVNVRLRLGHPSLSTTQSRLKFGATNSQQAKHPASFVSSGHLPSG
ncbi:hypothetical protein PoMZ_05549, partial [Pyricularia oryzae]